MSENLNPQPDDLGGYITIADLYPELTPEQQAEAEYRLLGYMTIVERIFERICRENHEILTELERRAMLRNESGPHS